MAFSTGAIANYFLTLAEREGVVVSPMKLQKLLYFAHGWYLAVTDGDPLLDEQVEAWQFGPVVSSVYHTFKHFGADPIKDEFVVELRRKPSGGGFRLYKPKLDPEQPDEAQVIRVLDKVWKTYKDISAVKLSRMTHEKGSPWDQVWSGMTIKRKNKDIDDALILKHFRQQIN